MDRLKPYWILPTLSRVRLIRDMYDPWDVAQHWDISPKWLKTNYPGTCFFSKMELGKNAWVRVWFYNFKIKELFRSSENRLDFAYWVDPSWLYEISLL